VGLVAFALGGGGGFCILFGGDAVALALGRLFLPPLGGGLGRNPVALGILGGGNAITLGLFGRRDAVAFRLLSAFLGLGLLAFGLGQRFGGQPSGGFFAETCRLFGICLGLGGNLRLPFALFAVGGFLA